MRNSVIILFFISVCCYCTKGYTDNTIYWFTHNTEDAVHLTQAINTQISTVKDTTRLLMLSVPQYQFNIEFAQSPSIARLLKKIPNACAPNRVKNPERLKDNIYSLPLNIALGLRLYYKRDSKASARTLNALNKDKQLTSLSALFTGKSIYTLGIDAGRSFGVFLDNKIASLDEHNLVIRSGGESTKSLVKMLSKDRIEYLIDYPEDINNAIKELPTPISLDSLAIADSPSYIVGYVACNKSPSGQKVINDINKALQQLYKSHQFYIAHTRYLDNSDIADFNQAYQEIFKVDVPKETPPAFKAEVKN